MDVDDLRMTLSAFVTETESALKCKVVFLDAITGSAVESKQHETILGERRGIYIFASQGDGKVLYVGKSESRSIWKELNNYLDNKRESVSLNRVQRGDDIRFPFCTMTLRKGQTGDWIHAIRQAQFEVVCVGIDPPHLSGLLERYALIQCRELDGQLPPINKVL